MPDPERCGSGTAVAGPGGWLLVDCGRGVAQRISQAGPDPAVDHHPLQAAVGYRLLVEGAVAPVAADDRSVTVSGDTAWPGIEALAGGTDVLIHEPDRSDLATPDRLDWKTGAGPVGAMAAQCGVGSLVLTDLLPTPRSERDEAAFVAPGPGRRLRRPAHHRDLLRL